MSASNANDNFADILVGTNKMCELKFNIVKILSNLIVDDQIN